ncbi:Protein glycosylation ligase [Pseudomonas guineae]|uniref:Protein glycosylation ligase n=2 Tax=Pseudomonas guineae TaxID=425504 RepID=A0A1I3E9A9_9PSED|nr:Protein glycosylation ligase [Pseudomonas guineae]
MAAMLLALLGWAIIASRLRWPVSRLVLMLVAISAIPLGHSTFGLLLFPGEAVLQVICMLAFAASVSLGQWGQLCQRHKLMDSLFASLVVAALFSTGLALYQWLALGGWGVLLPSIDVGGLRAVANVGQANNLATLLVWGMVGLWWGGSRQAIGVGIAAFGAAFLLLGLVLTGSRTGSLQAIFLGVMVVIFGRSEFLSCRLLVVAILGGWLAFLSVAVPVVGEFLFGAISRDILSVGIRPVFWTMALEALAMHPITGYGWNQVVTAHVLISDRYSGLGEVMGQTHNFFLDMLLWSGVLLGGGIIVGVLWWWWRQIRRATKETHWIILAALGVFLIHAMLELPHLYAFFYLPVGIMVGVASAYFPMKIAVLLPRGCVVFVGVVFAVLLGLMFRDYRLIEIDLTAHRMVAARIAGAETPKSPKILVLGFLQEALELLRTDPHRDIGDEDLERVRRAVQRYPAVGGLFRYAQSAALNNRPEEARWALQVICNLRSAKACAAVISDWRTLARAGNPEMNVVSLPLSNK